MKKLKTKNILLTVGIVILLAVIVYVRSRISPLIGNYSVEKNEKKVEAKPTMDTKSQETIILNIIPSGNPQINNSGQVCNVVNDISSEHGLCLIL